MLVRKLLLLILVLLQSGLAAGYAHAHSCSTHRQFHHTESPHVHAHQLLDLLADGEQTDDHHDEHDSDAFAVSDLTITPPPSEQSVSDCDSPAVPTPGTLAGFADRSPFLIGLPPSIAGPPSPLYLTFCTLRN